jgi:hypothetical protein
VTIFPVPRRNAGAGRSPASHHVRVVRRPDRGSCLSSVVKLGGLID